MIRSLLLLALLAALWTARDERTLERRFTSELEWSTDTFELTGSEDGHTVEQQGPRSVREQSDEIEILDTLFDDEDPPAKFTRLYRSVVSSFEIGSEKSPRTKTSSAGLEGKLVTFEREEDGAYARSSEDAGIRAGQLKRLRADLSFACFLPPVAEEPEVGAQEAGDPIPGTSWEISCPDLARLFSPLEEGVRRSRPKTAAAKDGLNVAPAAMSEPLSVLLAAAEGTTTATLLEAGEDEELPLNARLEFRITSTFDGAESMVGGLRVESGAEAEDDLELVYEGTGTLAWDPESGTIEIACEGDVRISESFSVRVEADGKTGEVSGKLALSGTLAFEGREQREE